MKAGHVWIILLLIISFITGWLLLNRNTAPFGKDNTSLALPAGSEITKIEFADETGKTILEKSGDKWLLNGKYETRKSSISFINRILHEIEIKSPVSEEMFLENISENGIKPVRVRAYEKRRLLTDFLVYKTSSNNYGNIVKKRSSSKPYIVHVPGYDGEIGSAFSMNELFWQPYTIFNLLPSEISMIHVETNDTSEAFSVKRQSDRLILTDGKKDLSGWDSTLVHRYLSYFTFIPFESWALDLGSIEKQNIVSEKPLYTITVLSLEEEAGSLKLWQRRIPDGTIDTDRMYGKTGKSDELFIVRYYDIDPLLKKRGYFFR